MHDDLALLSQVIEAGGFSRASTRTGIPKSRLSRRIEELERRLAVRLIDRSSRHFTPTPIGLDLARRGEVIRAEGENALRIIQESLSKPTGALRIASPALLTETMIADFCIGFSKRNPQVVITLDTTDGTKPQNMDAYDIALIASRQELPDTDMIARILQRTEYALVASPDWMAEAPALHTPNDLIDQPCIGWLDEERRSVWGLVSDRGEVAEIGVRTAMVTNNLKIVHKAAVAGLGMARLPLSLVMEDLATGRLRRVLPGWRPPTFSIHAIYRTRRSLQLAGRIFLDELAQHLRANRPQANDP
ncbi:transcriptional regulator, LysR family [Gemmobacter megaterium]|uniref:Transcriptional regulator, LysR family n=1 Tax=Gemmobacter megaterium TaxID=1086013 RepID=A0A1N7Q6N3_9RHOB|nr:LysR substrate-binding domain-containing protein [Gemmobacter megaterium]GGE23449.1 LysR family transcriptional regulator [Gemmobacter megaterium]SIT18369.1 transcriptional regulator, LysR family [Gemmobacter megaterium]